MDELPEVTVPPLPINLVPRPEALNALCEKILAKRGQYSQTVALTAVEGMGGIGKTVLAQMLCHDKRIRKAFPDGILWQTIGRESEIKPERRLRAVVEALRGDADKAVKAGMAPGDQYRLLMRDKAALLVIDDVWNAEDVRPWLAESARSRVLFTTRDVSIAGAVGAEEHWAQQLSQTEAQNVLKKWASLTGELPPEGQELIKECGRLALGVAIVGAMLRNKPPSLWKKTLDHLRSAELDKISGQFPGQHKSLFRALHASVEQLDDVQRESYLALAVLLEEMPATPVIHQTLWGMDADDAAEMRERLIGLSLVQRESDGESIKLHDLQLDYVRAQYPDPEALKVIHAAVRLSSHVITKDPSQFAPQLVGRLMQVGNPRVLAFVARIEQNAPCPWLRPLWPSLDSPGGALVRTLEGHEREVNGVALSRDGRIAVSASSDRTLKVWEVESGRLLRTLKGHAEAVNGVAMSGDGRLAVSASSDRTLKVWEVGNGRLLRTLKGHTNEVHGVAVSRDGRLAASASKDRTLKVWEVESGRLLHTLKGHRNYIRGAALSPDGRIVVSASWDDTLKVWEVESGRLLRTLKGHAEAVNGVALSGDGRLAVSASHDRTLQVWEVGSGSLLRTLEGHGGGVRGVVMSEDGRLAVSASHDRTLQVWEVGSGSLLRTLEGHGGGVRGVATSGDGQLAVSASEDKTLKVWEVETGNLQHTFERHNDWISGVATSGDGRLAVSASADGTLKVWEVETGRLLRTLEGHAGDLNGVAMSGDGRLAVSASRDNTLKVWEVRGGRLLHTLQGHTDWVKGVAMSGDGQLAVSASTDKTLKVWEVETGRLLRPLGGHSSEVNGVALSGDGRLAVSASGDKTLKVWEVGSGRLLHTLEGHKRGVRAVALSRDGRLAVSASGDKTSKVWDVASGRLLSTLKHEGEVDGVALSGDGRLVVSASRYKTLRIWDLNSATALAAFTCEVPTWCCAFIGSNRIIAGDLGGRLYHLQLMLNPPESRRSFSISAKQTGEVSNDVPKSGKHVFLSYCRDDKNEVARLRDDLLAAGESVWWDQDIKGGEDWKRAIRQAMKNAYAAVLCLSKKSEARTTSVIYPEALDAINAYREYAPGSIFLIPVRLSECEIPEIEIDATRTLDRLQYIDLFPANKRAEGIKKLLESIRATPHHPSRAKNK